MKVCGYGRVSTSDQSAEFQEKIITKTCKDKEWDLHKIYIDEGISGKLMENRPAILELVEDAKKKKFDMILFTKLDRIGRNLLEVEKWWYLINEELKLEIHCIDDPSINSTGKMGKLMRQFLGIFAEFERELIAERTNVGRADKWKSGKCFVGRSPFGYHYNKEDKKMEVVKAEADIYKKIIGLYLDENYSMIDVAIFLNSQSVPAPSTNHKKKPGKKVNWNTYTVREILKHTRYKGFAVYNQYKFKQIGKSSKYVGRSDEMKDESEWITIQFPKLISEDRWDKIQTMRQFRKSKAKKHHVGYEDKFMAENILYCGLCGKKMTKWIYRAKNGEVVFYYRCYWHKATNKELKVINKERCKLKPIKSDKIDEDIFFNVTEMITNPTKFAEQWLKDFDYEEAETQRNNLQNQVDYKEKKLSLAYGLLTDPDLTEKQRKDFRVKMLLDEKEHKDLVSKLKKVQHGLDQHTNKVDRLKQFQMAYKKSDKSLKVKWKTQAQFLTFLHQLPFKEKKRITESVISPETDGKCLICHPVPGDILAGDELQEIPKDDRTKPDLSLDPYVVMDFDLDLDKVEALISGLNKTNLLDKFSIG